MKLNPDCIRDILINIEEVVAPNEYFSFPPDANDALKSYSDEEVLYHLRQCKLSGFLVDASENLVGEFTIFDLTPDGHAFLANIRSDTVWNSAKKVAKKIGVGSLTALKDIAVSVVSEIIKATLYPQQP